MHSYFLGITNAIFKVENRTKEELKMKKRMMRVKVGLMAGLMALMATPAFARSISLESAGTTLWIFIIIGTIVVLLQLIPAAILFFSFIGTATTMAFRKEKKVEEEVVIPGAEPAVVKKLKNIEEEGIENEEPECINILQSVRPNLYPCSHGLHCSHASD